MTSVFVPQANARAAYHAISRLFDEAIARELASGSYIRRQKTSSMSMQDEFAVWLRERGIPYSSRRPFARVCIWARCKCHETKCPSILSIPIYPELSDDQTALVSKALGD